MKKWSVNTFVPEHELCKLLTEICIHGEEIFSIFRFQSNLGEATYTVVSYRQVAE